MPIILQMGSFRNHVPDVISRVSQIYNRQPERDRNRAACRLPFHKDWETIKRTCSNTSKLFKQNEASGMIIKSRLDLSSLFVLMN